MATTLSSSETLRRYFEAYNARDAEAIGRLVTGTVTLSRPGQSVSGRDALIGAYETDWADFPDCRLELKTPVADGNRVFAEATWRATNTGSLHLPDGTVAPPTGRAVVLECVAAGELEGGLLSALRVYWDNAASMQQLGLLPG